MNIAFFCRDDGIQSPTEQFLTTRYGKYLNPQSADLSSELIGIGSVWRYGLEKKGVSDGASNYLEKFKGYDALCLRIKQSRILIRFPYYRDQTNDRIVLLLGFAKIDDYKHGGKIDREVTRKLDEAQIYYDEYNLNNNKFISPQIINDILSY